MTRRVLEKLCTKKVCVDFLAPILATPSACHRGPKPRKCRKWLGEGPKGLSDPGSKGLPRVFCTTQTLFCTGATLFCTSARGLCSLGPKDLLHPLLTTFGTFEVSDPCSRHSGSQPYSKVGGGVGRTSNDLS